MDVFFVSPNDPILKKVAKYVPLKQTQSSEVKEIIQLMLKIIKGEQEKQKKGVGLAAPQIGISKRIILVDIAANGKGKTGELKAYINPKIIWISKRKGEWYEGCFSTGEICGIVSRPIIIKIQAFNQDGKFLEEKHKGYAARIFQHEVDHLDGKVFVNKILDPNKLHWVKKKEFPLYRKSWRNWPKKYSFERWQKIKGVV